MTGKTKSKTKKRLLRKRKKQKKIYLSTYSIKQSDENNNDVTRMFSSGATIKKRQLGLQRERFLLSRRSSRPARNFMQFEVRTAKRTSRKRNPKDPRTRHYGWRWRINNVAEIPSRWRRATFLFKERFTCCYKMQLVELFLNSNAKKCVKLFSIVESSWRLTYWGRVFLIQM